MPEFQAPADIGNRALQHCGADLMDSTLGFAEQSNRARSVAFAYGKLRRAELQRNVWTFATRVAVLRPLDSNTALVAPSLWSSQATYFVGSLVQDQAGTLWISRIPNNVGTASQPGVNFTAWEPYFGPLTVSLYDSTQSYATGEIVYTAVGDGTYKVYLSLVEGNAIHPALPSQWSVASVYYTNDVVQKFPLWSSLTTYTKGQSVTDGAGNVWASLVNSNLNQNPATSPTKWAAMPLLTLAQQLVPNQSSAVSPPASPVLEWLQAQTYALGNFVMFNGSVYVSLAAANAGQFPNAAGSTWWALCTGGTLYMSLIDFNVSNDPGNTPAQWAIGTTYASGNVVLGSDGIGYSSVINGNVGNNPVGDDSTHWQRITIAWTTIFTQGGGNSQWTQVGGANFPNGVVISPLNITYPLNSGPASSTATRNAFRLPANHLRCAPQDPKAGAASYLGAPSGRAYDDWQFQDDYFVTREVGAIPYRFVADVQDVTKFHDLFCEGLACRVGLEVCEPLTQSTAKLAGIKKMYDDFMGDARLVDAIEAGSTEPPLDDFIACRA